MKVSPSAIKSVGLTILYEPDDPSDAVADVVLVHGLGGHPVRSWKWIGRPDPPQTPKSARSGTGSFKRLLRRDATLRRSNSEPLLVLGTKQDSSGRSRNVLRKNSLKSTSRLRLDTSAGDPAKSRDAEVYWPLDLLPRSCPNARIAVWGYHTLVSDGQPLRLQNDVFAHARELMLDLADAREATGTTNRPIIFIAHSTGGILVKEVLRLSEEEGDGPVKGILLSTSAMIFLGCPHRGSEHARLGDAIRSMASMTLGVDSRDPVLWDLSGSASLELELGRQAFARMWDDYNFRVKTYQESMVSAAEFLEIRAEAAVRRQASFFGVPREAAETMAASHVDMCKFGSAEDGGYRSLANTLAGYIRAEANHRHTITQRELECLAALARRQFPLYETHSATTYPGTCLWLYDLPEFQAWHHRTDGNKNKILWIKGQSGSGKSVLLRSLRSRIEKQWAPAGGTIIWARASGRDTNTIYFPGTSLPHVGTDPSGVYRSLLAQLFLQDPHLRKALVALHERRCPRGLEDDAAVVSFFADDYVASRIETPARRTFVFVDVADDCGPAYLRDLLAHLAQLARSSDFSVFVASGDPLGGIVDSDSDSDSSIISVQMQHRNADDILRYVNLALVAEWEERDRTVSRVGAKAAGVFLWAEIVVNILNAAIGEGASQDLIERTLDEMPGDLHGLYEWMLATLNDRERAEARVLFQWVVLAAEPLRLNDLLVAVRLTLASPHDEPSNPYTALEPDPHPSSMRELRKIRNSEVTTDNPCQLNRWIRARSIGLLELRSSSSSEGGTHGGFVNEPWGLQRVQVAHDSVRTFFLSGRGFACLAPTSTPTSSSSLSTPDLIDQAHYSLLRACLTYLNMRDFEPLASSHSPLSPPPPPPPFSPASSTWTSKSAHDQRHLVTSSYPFLQYAVRNLLFHMLSPSQFRHFLPQAKLLRTFAADRCRLWRRWTALLGCRADDHHHYRNNPDNGGGRGGAGGGGGGGGVLALHTDGPAAPLLSPVFGARGRLERVFRRLRRMAAAEAAAMAAGVVSPGLAGFPAPPASSVAGSEKTVWGGSVKSPRSEHTVWGGSVKSPRSEGGSVKSPRTEKDQSIVSPRSEKWAVRRPEKGKMPLSSYWNTERAANDRGQWPLSPESGYSSHYSGQAGSEYSSAYSSRRSPLRVDTFERLDGGGVGLGVARVEVGFGTAGSA